MLISNAYTSPQQQELFPGLIKLQNKLKLNQENLLDVTNETLYVGQTLIKIKNRTYDLTDFNNSVKGKTAKLFQTPAGQLVNVYITTTHPYADIDILTPVIGREVSSPIPQKFEPFTDYTLLPYKSKVLKAYLAKENNKQITEKVVGTTFRPYMPIEAYEGTLESDTDVPVLNTTAVLMPEPTNEYDPNAIAVLTKLQTGDTHHIGYLSKSGELYRKINEPTLARLTIYAYSKWESKYNDSVYVTVDASV